MRGSALRLSLHRLGHTLGGRLGWLGGGAIAVVFASAASGGQEMTVDAVRALCWLAAGPAALSAARAPSERDRGDGIELLVATRGIDHVAWRRMRMFAAMLGCAARVALPALVVAVTVAIVSGAVGPTLRAAGAVVGGAIAGALIGAVAALCGEAGGSRGRSLFAAVVLLPWLVSDLWSAPGLSLVGAVDAGLSFLSEAAASWS